MCSIRSRESRSRYRSPRRIGVRAADLVAVAGADAALRGADVLAVGACSCRALVSSAMCQGKITWARSLSIRFSPTLTPRAARPSISSRMLAGLSTTPPVTTHCTPGVQDAAGDERELVGLAAGDDRVAGVGPALIANDDVVLLGQQVDDLALGLVAPLQTDDASTRHGTGPHDGARADAPAGKAANATRTVNRPDSKCVSRCVQASDDSEEIAALSQTPRYQRRFNECPTRTA